MKIEREKAKFRPITLTIESKEELEKIIGLLQEVQAEEDFSDTSRKTNDAILSLLISYS